MKTANKIIAYMRLKRELSVPNYLNRKDERDILNALEHVNNRIWEKITYTKYRFSVSDCPFCTYNYKYTDCHYGERHGRCAKEDSTWNKVMWAVKEPLPNGEPSYETKPDIHKKLDDLVELLNNEWREL